MLLFRGRRENISANYALPFAASICFSSQVAVSPRELRRQLGPQTSARPYHHLSPSSTPRQSSRLELRLAPRLRCARRVSWGLRGPTASAEWPQSTSQIKPPISSRRGFSGSRVRPSHRSVSPRGWWRREVEGSEAKLSSGLGSPTRKFQKDSASVPCECGWLVILHFVLGRIQMGRVGGQRQESDVQLCQGPSLYSVREDLVTTSCRKNKL